MLKDETELRSAFGSTVLSGSVANEQAARYGQGVCP